MGEPTPQDLLRSWLLRQADEAGRQWLANALERLEADPSEATLFRYIGFAGRKLGRDLLDLTPEDLAAAQRTRGGWRPDRWTTDGSARVCMLLHRAGDPRAFAHTLDRLCQMGEMQELVAYYRGLPLYPDALQYVARAAEGLRSNMQVVFDAVAHDNPYPAEHLGEGAWNQMVLKALFIGSRLAPMQGIDARANPALMRMLCDYAHERWAASRTISPELWRCVGPHADEAAIDDLARALADPDSATRGGAALALAACPHPRARAILAAAGAADLQRSIEAGELTWETLLP